MLLHSHPSVNIIDTTNNITILAQVPAEGAVAADDGVCSSGAGLAMLRERGSAVDAAVAALLCCSVTHPHLVGVGG